MSHGEVPEEFQGYPIDLDESLDIPLTIREKTHTDNKQNQRLGIAIKRSYKNFRRYKKHYWVNFNALKNLILTKSFI